MSEECVQWLILRSFKRNVNLEKKLKLIYIANETKYIKIILYCIKHEIFFNSG